MASLHTLSNQLTLIVNEEERRGTKRKDAARVVLTLRAKCTLMIFRHTSILIHGVSRSHYDLCTDGSSIELGPTSHFSTGPSKESTQYINIGLVTNHGW